MLTQRDVDRDGMKEKKTTTNERTLNRVALFAEPN